MVIFQAPDGVPQDLAVMEKTNVSCTFSWLGIPPHLANGIIAGYEAFIENVNTTDPADNLTGFQIICASSLNATFKNLKPFHMYNITVSGFNSKAVSNKSEPLQCLTDEDREYFKSILELILISICYKITRSGGRGDCKRIGEDQMVLIIVKFLLMIWREH